MLPDREPEIFNDGILVTLNGEDEPDDGSPSGLEFYERCVEKKLATDTDVARVATVRQTMQRLMSRTNAPERNREDYYLIVRYLLHGCLN